MYFVHEFKPASNEHALLDDPEMLKAVTAINRQIHDLAPVLNEPTVEPGAAVTSADKDAPVVAMTKRREGAAYVFAVNASAKATKAGFAVPGLSGPALAEAID